MPKLLSFKTKSVIYFQGDKTHQFYLLRRGSVMLSNDFMKRHEEVQVGNFFGSQATLTGNVQGDTAMATLPSEVLALDYQEFMSLVQSNEALRSNMLQNFNAQLINIHAQVVQLMSKAKEQDEDVVTFESSLIKSANFFLKNRAYLQAKQSYATYLERFASGEFAEMAAEKLAYCTQKVGSSDDLSEKLYLTISTQQESNESVLTPMQVEYNDMLVLMNQKKLTQALVKLTKLVRMENDEAFSTLNASCQFLLGETLMQMDKYADAIEPLQAFTNEFTEHDDIAKARLYLATAYEKTGKDDKAMESYKVLLKSLPSKSPMYSKVQQLINNLTKKNPS